MTAYECLQEAARLLRDADYALRGFPPGTRLPGDDPFVTVAGLLNALIADVQAGVEIERKVVP